VARYHIIGKDDIEYCQMLFQNLCGWIGENSLPSDRSKSVSLDRQSLSSDWHKSAKARIGRNIVVEFLVARAAPRPPTARENNGISPCFTSAAENSGALEIESLDSDWPSGVSDSEQIA